MTEGFATPAAVHVKGDKNKYTRKPKKMPASGDDQAFEYVVYMKRNSPVAYATILGICIQKYLIDKNASYVKNEGKIFYPKVPVFLLTEKQANAILERAKETMVRVRSGSVSNWVCIADHVVIKKTVEATEEQYKEVKRAYEQRLEQQIENNPSNKVAEELIKQQADEAGKKAKKR